MSWVGGNIDCSVNLAAEGYYQNSYQYCYYTPAYSHDGEIIANDYYFDVNGNMTWGRSGNGAQTYRNDYDKNGRLIRSVVDGADTIIDTFTYDQNGLLTNGFTANTFAPNSTCTRGQGVTFLYRGIGLY